MVRMLRLTKVLAVLHVAACSEAPQAAPVTAAAAPDEPASAGAPLRSQPVESNGDGPGCTAAVETWIAESGGEAQNPPPEYDEELKKALSRGTYLNDCRVPPSAAVSVCAAVLDGTVRGVTVTIDPAEQEHADCVAEAISRMQFTAQPIMSLTRTQFEPSL